MKVGDYVYCKSNYPEGDRKYYPYKISHKYIITFIDEFDCLISGDGIDNTHKVDFDFSFVEDRNRHYFYDVFYTQEEIRKIKLESL